MVTNIELIKIILSLIFLITILFIRDLINILMSYLKGRDRTTTLKHFDD